MDRSTNGVAHHRTLPYLHDWTGPLVFNTPHLPRLYPLRGGIYLPQWQHHTAVFSQHLRCYQLENSNMCPGANHQAATPAAGAATSAAVVGTASASAGAATLPGARPGAAAAAAFTNAARVAFDEYLRSAKHTNRYELDYTRMMALKVCT